MKGAFFFSWVLPLVVWNKEALFFGICPSFLCFHLNLIKMNFDLLFFYVND